MRISNIFNNTEQYLQDNNNNNNNNKIQSKIQKTADVYKSYSSNKSKEAINSSSDARNFQSTIRTLASNKQIAEKENKHSNANRVKSQNPYKASNDSINVSSDARDFQITRKALANDEPNVEREDKVNSLKQQIKNGSYNISSMDIASKIMQGY